MIFNKLVVMKKKKSHSAGFKTKVGLEALQESESIQQIAKQYDLHPTEISTWKSTFLAAAQHAAQDETAGKRNARAEQPVPAIPGYSAIDEPVWFAELASH